MKAHLVRIVAVIVLLLAVSPLVSVAAPPEPAKETGGKALEDVDPSVLSKIEPLVLKELNERSMTTYLVYLRAKADLGLAQAQTDKLSRRVAVVRALQETAQRSQAAILTYLAGQQTAGRVKELTSYWIFNGLAVTGDRETLLALAARADVERIQANHVRRLDDAATLGSADTQMPAAAMQQTEADNAAASQAEVPASIEWNVAKVRANEVWTNLGINGQNIVVANMDTGVYYQHPALQQAYRGYSSGGVDHNYNWFDPTGTYPQVPNDGHGHGTHTMGTMVGVEPNGSNQIGVAPGAKWVAIKVFTDGGSTTDAILHAGFQWVMAPTDVQGQNPDPTKAPDIASNSWGDANSNDQTFWDDILAWRAAGIMPVFAAGNEGPNAGTVDSPGSLPQSLAVGATNIGDVIADFSGRGPSPWGEIKPEVSAPGVNVRSSVPPSINPGLYEGGWNGTSMATPHAAGLTALIWQARPDLTITATEYVLTSTALPLPSPSQSPNNNYGWGRLDAFQAVASILNGGRFWGRVTDAGNGDPVAGALISLRRQDAEGSQQTASDARGYYTFTVAAGIYQVSAGNFWYITQTVPNVAITTGFTTILDFPLQRRATGVLRGQVASGGMPLTATISVAGVPMPLQTDAGGVYSASLPADTYSSMRVRPATGHSHGSAAGIVIAAGAETVRNFDLAAAPTILLVDADAWTTGSQIGYYRSDLDDLFYSYDQWRVLTFPVGLPPTSTLAVYDIVVWHQPSTSPGYINAWSRLASYLDQGGRLFISGQDIGYWDDSGASRPFYRTYLHAQLVRDNSDLTSVRGLRGDIFADLALGLNAADSASNQTDPDAISALDASASAVFSYTTAITTGATAALKVATDDFQVVYLAFGLEGTGARSVRQQTLAQALSWLASPILSKTVDPASAAPGEVVTFTLTLDNRSQSTVSGLGIVDTLPQALTYIDGSAAGGLTYTPATRRLEWQGAAPADGALTFTFQARLGAVPGGTLVLNTATLTTASGASLPSSTHVLVAAPDLRPSRKGAAPSVAASGHEITYTIALTNAGIGISSATLVDPIPAGTTYVTDSVQGGATYNPALNRIEWTGVLTPADPMAGQLVYTTSDDQGGPIFAWVDISGTGTRIATGDDTLHGPYDLGFPFTLFGQSYNQVWVSSNGWLSFQQPSGPVYSNVCLPDPSAPRAMLAAWWDDLDGTAGDVYYLRTSDTFILSYVGVPRYSSGGPYTFQAILRADGTITYQYLDMRGSRLNEATIGLQDATGARGLSVVCNQNHVHNNLAILFTPRAQLGATPVFTFRVRVNEGVPLQSAITNTAVVSSMSITQTLSATAIVNTVDLTNTAKTVDKTLVGFGDSVAYTVTLRNSGNATATAALTDVLPAQIVYIPGSASAGATYDPAARAIFWSGPLAPGGAATVSFSATFVPGLADNTIITNTARISDPLGRIYQRSAATLYRAADLSASSKHVAPSSVAVGDQVTFTITVANGGGGPTGFVVTDTLPLGLSYVPGTARAGTGTVSYDPGLRRFIWTGNAPGQHLAYLHFVSTVDFAGAITNTVQILDTSGRIVERSAAVTAPGAGPTPTPTPRPSLPLKLWLPIIIDDSEE